MFHLLLLALLFSNSSAVGNSAGAANAFNAIIPSANALVQNATNDSINTTAVSPASGNFTGKFQGNFSVAQQSNASASAGAIASVVGAIFGSRTAALNILITYKYTALFILTTADASGLPPPSEFIMPPAGYLARLGYVNFGLAFWFIMVGNVIGLAVDYTIAYEAGEAFFYRNKAALRDKKKYLDSFKQNFTKYGSFAIFIAKLVPIARTAVSFVAGVLQIPAEDYYPASVMGAFIYNYVYMVLGYAFISESISAYVLAVILGLPVLLYALFMYYSMKNNARKKNPDIKPPRSLSI